MEAAADKLQAAQARLAAEGGSCPDLDNLLATLRGLEKAEALIPPNAMAARPGGDIALPMPLPNAPWSIQLFKGLWEYIQSGVTGSGSIGYVTTSSALFGLLGTGMGPFGSMHTTGGSRELSFMPASQVDNLARQGMLGSLSILQLLAAGLALRVISRDASNLAETAERLTATIKAVWGTAATTTQRALHARLERQQWVPQFGGTGSAPTTPRGAEPAKGLQQDLQQYCGLSSGDAAMQAVWAAALTLRLGALAALPEPSRPQMQLALCDAQALLDCCPTPPATAAHLANAILALQLVGNASSFAGFDRQRRQAAWQLGQEVLARAEGQQCWYSAALAAITVASLSRELGLGLQSGRMRGAGRALPGEAEDYLGRGREAAARVAGYRRHLKPWLPAGLMSVYANWVQQAAAMGGPSPATATDAARGDPVGRFPVCSYCASPSLHIRRCAACRGPGYCSKECQRGDWPRHKPECKAAVARAAAGQSAGAAAGQDA